MRFKEGDKVKVKTFKEIPGYWNPKMSDLMGEVVTIECILRDGFTIKSKDVVWYLKESDVEPVKNECIMIHRKDNQVIALDKATGKKAVAKCSPEDEFNFYTGAKLAFERLTGTPEIEFKCPLNTKICITETHFPTFTKGKIYTINNGKIKDNYGNLLPLDTTFYSMEEVEDYFSKQKDWKHIIDGHFNPYGLGFVEVVE